MEGYHRPVLLREVLEFLQVRKDNWYLDCTLGDGGHTLEILRSGGKVVGIDVDPQALERVSKRFEEEGIEKSKFRLIRGNFRDVKSLILQQMDSQLKFAGAIFDLGVSSLQLESPQRGFSFTKSGPLDMRMDPNLQIQALDLISGLNKGELYELFSKLGEEKHSRTLAEAVVRTRALNSINTTKELAEVVEKALGQRKGRISARLAKRSIVIRHPATKIFQSLRIAVNDELNALKTGLDQVKDLIEKGGHIVVISFHSLEDRIVKNTFRDWEYSELGKIVTRKPILPSDEEVQQNPRSRSAKLRTFEIL